MNIYVKKNDYYNQHISEVSNFLLSIFIIMLVVFFAENSLSKDPDPSIDIRNNDIPAQCEKALIWYEDRPGLKGEYVRVLEYCKTYAKDKSPTGFETNPILSDFGSMSGVNTRPRDHIHQGIDIIGPKNQPIIAIADGKVLETTVEDCWGATVIIDHGVSSDGKNLIAIYGHVGDFLVEENQIIKRGDIIAKLPEKVKYRCMARVRHLHLQIGQRYCKKEEKDNWGCKYFIKDFYMSLNPHDYWADGANKVTCFEKNRVFKKGTITYPFPCTKTN